MEQLFELSKATKYSYNNYKLQLTYSQFEMTMFVSTINQSVDATSAVN